MKSLSKIDFLKWGQTMLVVAAMALPFSTVLAALPQPGCGQLSGINCGGSTDTVATLIITILNIIIGLAFIIAVLFLVIGGFRYMTAGGNEENAEKGQKTIVNALIGIVVIILSYVIVKVVSNTISNSGNGGNTGP